MSERHGLPFHGLEHLCRSSAFRPGRFARLFAGLPPFYVDPQVLHQVGRAGGPMDGGSAGPPTQAVPAGLIFFGQFVDHDLTLDTSSSLHTTNDPSGTDNVRTPTLDLDCVYGSGPDAHPFLYAGGVRLLTGADSADPSDPNDLRRHDLPRSAASGGSRAIIGDPRNDENRIVSQLQLGFLGFHNKVVDRVAASSKPPAASDLFKTARRGATWHYQWVVVNDYLRTICGDWIIDDILAHGRRVYRPETLGSADPFIPIEFSTAAYRYGHSMIPQKLRVKADPKAPQHDLFGPVLGQGFGPVTSAAQIVEWKALLDGGDGKYERATQLDAKLAADLLKLPNPVVGRDAQDFERSLAVRNLLRGQSFLIPSGEAVANAMIAAGAREISSTLVAAVRTEAHKLGFPAATPLWLYILLEGSAVGRMSEDAQGKKIFAKGEGLGPVGARLVAETILGLLELDPRSFLGSNRGWSPLDSADVLKPGGVKTLYELLTL